VLQHLGDLIRTEERAGEMDGGGRVPPVSDTSALAPSSPSVSALLNAMRAAEFLDGECDPRLGVRLGAHVPHLATASRSAATISPTAPPARRRAGRR
jgi:hypothetical protein